MMSLRCQTRTRPGPALIHARFGRTAGHAKVIRMPSPIDDAQLVERIVAGDLNLYSELVARYSALVTSIAARHVPRENVAEVAHEAFLQGYQSLAALRARDDFKSWIARITVRRCYDFWRARRRCREIPISALSGEQNNTIEAAICDRARREFADSSRLQAARRLLACLLDQLSPEDRMVVELVHIEERSTAEAADLLGWSRANVKVRAFRARRRMRSLLKGVIMNEDDTP